MPKRTKKNRYMTKGGNILMSTSPTTAQGYPSATAPATAPATSAFSNWFNGATTAIKKAASSAVGSVSTAATSATGALQKSVLPPQRTFGGKRCRKGGKMVDMPIPTAKPQVWVGGKTRKITCNKRHKHTKSCKNKPGNRKKRSRKSKFPFSESLKRLIKM
jgi:hypothetical protein